MARIRYIGDQLIARAFERTFHRNYWDGEHGLKADEVAVLSRNPQFEVDGLNGENVTTRAELSDHLDHTPAGMVR